MSQLFLSGTVVRLIIYIDRPVEPEIVPDSFEIRDFLFGLCFPFGLFSFILTADPADHALVSIHILSLSPEFHCGKGISRALDLHADISCLDMSLLLVDIMTNNTQ